MATTWAVLANKYYDSVNKKYVIYTYVTDDDGGLALSDCAIDVVIFRAVNAGYPSRALPKRYGKVSPLGAITSSHDIVMTRTDVGTYEITGDFDGTELLSIVTEMPVLV